MPSCCSNCRTKFSLFNKEDFCSSCALSFCKKCLGYRANLPRLADRPLTVCYECYQRIENNKIKPSNNDNAQVSVHSLPSVSTSSNSSHRTGVLGEGGNWWGEGLPPPSFRQTMQHPHSAPLGREKRLDGPPPYSKVQPIPHRIDNMGKRSQQNRSQDEQDRQIEERAKALRKDLQSETPPIPTTDELEERLARLRGVDVELIRNPRKWFESSQEPPRGNTVKDLMESAHAEAAIERKWEPGQQYRETDLDAVDENQEVRQSVVSNDFSEATKEELQEINRLMEDASTRVATTNADEKKVEEELKNVMKLTRQKSMDIQKVNNEFGEFWNRQMDKNADVSESDDDEPMVTDEMLRKIVTEAEAAADMEPNKEPQPEDPVKASPRKSNKPVNNGEPVNNGVPAPNNKKGFLGRFFKR